MEIVILAQTESKLSYQDGIESFYREYAVAHNLTGAERDAFYKDYRLDNIYAMQNPTITMSRRVDVLFDGTVSPREWTYYDCFDGLTLAANRFGDSAYYKATSKHTLHA